MQQFTLKTSHALALVIAGMLLSTSPAFADRPSWGGHNKAGRNEWRERPNHDRDRNNRSSHQGDRDGFGEHHYFDDRHRTIINGYYAEQFRTGQCPPGLAKKHNGCMPPGLAKQWQIGYPLPSQP